MALTETDRELIRAAVRPYRKRGAEAMALEEISGLSSTRAYQRLNQLLGDPVAWEVEPAALLVLRKRRDRRQRYSRVRSAR